MATVCGGMKPYDMGVKPMKKPATNKTTTKKNSKKDDKKK